MRRRELARYHDLASSTKTRGAGIGFAGVGIKLGLLVCEEVVTEARRRCALEAPPLASLSGAARRRGRRGAARLSRRSFGRGSTAAPGSAAE